MDFKKEKQEIDGEAVFVFSETSRVVAPFTMLAGRSGLKFMGQSPDIGTDDDLEKFAYWVAQAWEARRALVPKLI